MSLKKDWTLRIDEGVYDALAAIPKDQAAAVVRTIAQIGENPYRGGSKMGGESNCWCRRVDTCFIFYDIHPGFRFIHITDVDMRPIE